MSGWISVEDRLPVGYGLYLCTLENQYQNTRVYIAGYFPTDKEFWVPEIDLKESKVTHWMPLPDPPKDEDT